MNTHDPSLRNSNQDECEPMAWVIPISFCSQEQDTGLLGLIDVFNRAENELVFKVIEHVIKKRGVSVFFISSKE